MNASSTGFQRWVIRGSISQMSALKVEALHRVTYRIVKSLCFIPETEAICQLYFDKINSFKNWVLRHFAPQGEAGN